MKQTKSKLKKEDKTVIGDEWSGEDRPDYICSWCQRTLSKLIDSGGQNPCYFCNSCQISFDPSEIPTRKKSKLGTQHEEVEPAVASIQNTPDVSIRHEPELRGGFAALAKKGTIRFTSYNTNEKQ
jgi:hypothetical protein